MPDLKPRAVASFRKTEVDRIIREKQDAVVKLNVELNCLRDERMNLDAVEDAFKREEEKARNECKPGDSI